MYYLRLAFRDTWYAMLRGLYIIREAKLLEKWAKAQKRRERYGR